MSATQRGIQGKSQSRLLTVTALTAAILAVHIQQAHAQAPATQIAQADRASTAQAEARRAFDIAAQPLDAAIIEFSRQANLVVTAAQELVRGKSAPAIQGDYTPLEALQKLLEGSGLRAQRTPAGAMVLVQAGSGRTSDVSGGLTPSDPSATTLGTLTVTGTRIRGGSTPSPVITIGAERIQEEGFSDLGEVVRSVPQNFSGGQNPGVTGAAGANNIANQNITGGSGLNLRGLGPDATLTLLNGRRMSYGGFVQAVDISAIPVETVERIEIVADGASAIYGSDAVGGVGNVILKRDFDGVTVGARYGTATDGGLTTREYTATAGTTWSSGGLIATYKDTSTDPIYADQRGYTDNIINPRTIYPGIGLRSGLLSAYQSIGDIVELRLDALRTERERLQYTGFSTNYYRSTPETITSLVSPSIEFLLSGGWTLSVGGSWGKDEASYNDSMVTLATGISTLSDSGCYCNESRSYEASAEGPLFALGGGDARIAIGAGYRTNDFLTRNYITGTTSTEGDDSSRFAYAELSLPLVGPESNIAGAQRLTLIAAVRGEDYKSFGGVTTPKLGLIYGPSADFTLKASWGKSFKAPTLNQRYQSKYAFLYAPNVVGGTGYAADATVLVTYGGSRDLDAERARTWTASLAFHPEALPNLEAELTWFDIDYTDRVVEPISTFSQGLSNPIYAEFVDFAPTAEQQAEILATSTFFNNADVAYDPNNVVAILFNQYTNAARQRVKGLDLSGSYRFDLGNGRLTMRGSASWLDSTRQVTASQSVYDLAGTIFNPARLNTRLGAVWNRGGFTASTFANYTGGVLNTVTAGITEKTASFTTLDATLRYGTGEHNGVWSGLELALSAQNLFDRSPPSYTPTSTTVLRYDSTNYSAIGRFVSVSISKHW